MYWPNEGIAELYPCQSDCFSKATILSSARMLHWLCVRLPVGSTFFDAFNRAVGALKFNYPFREWERLEKWNLSLSFNLCCWCISKLKSFQKKTKKTESTRRSAIYLFTVTLLAEGLWFRWGDILKKNNYQTGICMKNIYWYCYIGGILIRLRKN